MISVGGFHHFGSSVAGSTEPVFSQDSFPHMVFQPCYQLPGVFGSTQNISCSSAVELVFLMCFPGRTSVISSPILYLPPHGELASPSDLS